MITGIGVVFDHLGPSQMAHCGLEAVNAWCHERTDIGISIFAEHQIKPCQSPACPVFGIEQMAGWDKPLIATSLDTGLAAIKTKASTIAYYLVHPDAADARVVLDPRVQVFARSSDYVSLIRTNFALTAQFVPCLKLTSIFHWLAQGAK